MPPNANLDKGYEVVESSLAGIKTIADKAGIQLLVITIADPYQIDKNWIAVNGLDSEEHFAADLPNQKVNQICQKLGIDNYDMYPVAMQYIEENELRFPYFSLTCDRHLSPFGNRVFADFIHRFLQEHNYVSAP